MKFKILLIFIGLIGPVFQASAAGQITVTGQGSVEAVPDMATISLGVTTQAKTAAEALTVNSETTAAILEQVATAGILPRDVITSGLSLSPNWLTNTSDGSSAIVGFIANNQVTIRVRDLPSLGMILDQVVRNGANTFNGLMFGLQDPAPKMDEARRRAVEDAIRKAELYAAAASVALGPISDLTENGGMLPVPMFRQSDMMMEASVPVAEGEISIAASVTVVFEIAD